MGEFVPEKYLRRVIDERFENQLNAFGAICLRGPKWCGKTTTASRYAKSRILMQGKDAKAYLKAADTDLSLILDGPTPRLIDEWQEYPQIWDSVRYEVDERNDVGQFILTGSSAPKEGSMKHSGAGRFGFLDMYPMSLFESGESNGTVSLRDLFSGTADLRGATTELTVRKLAECICRGGWPANLGLSQEICRDRMAGYLKEIFEGEDFSTGRYNKDVHLAESIIRSYSRNICTMASLQAIYRDVQNAGIALSDDRFHAHIKALRNAYLISDVPAWNPAIRSKSAIRASEKRNLTDPSIAAYYLGITPDNFIEDFNTFGFLFESMCIRDLKVYSSALRGDISYYHDRYGLEADAVIHLDDGRYALAEVKLGSREIDEGAMHLCRIEELVREKGLKLPSFKMVLTGGNQAYMRSDGVAVVPIGCLRD
ncbi:MAG: DUF4143 domain-containing protein [Candidatus Methanomethylophilus sp.]|jgi:predicted AAA+ superfamily ATPase|nr:DUF4143 domain-containing protein [Methanomethylophilus sp.]MCI2075009.1 DUF4143 domain-containing protein [Methanomethylophilus sp.]TQS81470.1 MAG: hypothetical protein A3Q59_05345 [Methanomethylophilus alvi]